jgi:hypothetical protein
MEMLRLSGVAITMNIYAHVLPLLLGDAARLPAALKSTFGGSTRDSSTAALTA